MGKGPFVGLLKLRHPLIGTRIIESAATEPQHDDEDVHDRRTGAEGHGGLAPIDLTLLARRGFELQERPVRLEWTTRSGATNAGTGAAAD